MPQRSGRPAIADYRPILEKLIGFPTVSVDSNLECIDYIENVLSEKGCQTSRFYNREKTKANLIARIGPETPGGIMLSGHTDVVPVAGQDWDTDPFCLVEKNGLLYGRGSSDMKGFLALAMEAATGINPDKLQQPLYLVFTYDEEVGCLGAKDLMEEMRTRVLQPQFVLIGEPTNMELVTAHKGISISTTHIRGRPAHACRPDLGASAIAAAARLIRQIADIIPAEQDERFDPPTATFNIGTVHGGNATNIIAHDCTFAWELRPLPSQDAQSILDGFSELIRALEQDMPGIFVDQQVVAVVPGMQEGKNRTIATELHSLLRDSKLSTAAFTTEAGLFQQAGIPAIVCGPGHINQAHQPNENIAVTRMDQYRKFLFNVMQTLTSA